LSKLLLKQLQLLTKF